MAIKTHFTTDDIQNMLAGYDLGDIIQTAPISAGTVQTNLTIETTAGKYVLKYYDNRTIASIKFEANLVNYLQKRNFPCAAVIKNRRGASVSILHDKAYILFDYLSGTSAEALTPQQREQVVQTAAHLQNITRRYHPRQKAFRWNYSRELCLQLARESAAKLDTENAYAKLRWFEAALSALQLPQSLPKGICHTDYDESNLLFDGEQFVALLDFDDANYTYLVYDLATFANGWAWPHDGEFSPKEARRMAQAYLKIRRLSKLEQRHLFDVHKLSILFDGIWFYARGHVDDFYERQKIEFLDNFGRGNYYQALFG